MREIKKVNNSNRNISDSSYNSNYILNEHKPQILKKIKYNM